MSTPTEYQRVAAELAALRAGVEALVSLAEQATAMSLSTDFNGNKFQHQVSTAALRNLLEPRA